VINITLAKAIEEAIDIPKLQDTMLDDQAHDNIDCVLSHLLFDEYLDFLKNFQKTSNFLNEVMEKVLCCFEEVMIKAIIAMYTIYS
jgi:hypothetical protein